MEFKNGTSPGASISDKIKSIRETVGYEYKKPDKEVLEAYKHLLFDPDTKYPHALEYLLKQRGLTLDTAKHFQLGYDPKRDAIAIPIFKKGELINFKYRLFKGDTRYTSETGCEHWVYNEDGVTEGLKKGGVLIVEGEFDCMRVWQDGITNVVSPSSGKDSYGLWIAQIDPIRKIYIAYDNDEGGRSTSYKMAERLGVDRCFEVVYEGQKDASDYLNATADNNIKDLIKKARPFTSRQFRSLGDVINSLRSGEKVEVKTEFIPKVGFQKGWMGVVSGRSNVGKTAFVLNIADELTARGVGVLIFPFERGIESVGERYLNIMSSIPSRDFAGFTKEDWDKLLSTAAERPLYFAMPNKEQVVEYIIKSKRYFDTKVVIVDHIDYLVRQVTSSRGDAISDTLQSLKSVCEEHGIILIVVAHIRKTEAPGQFIAREKKPNIEDLKGSASLYQDPEVVVMLSQTINEGEIAVDVLKNKGEMGNGLYAFDTSTGKFNRIEAFHGVDLWESSPDLI